VRRYGIVSKAQPLCKSFTCGIKEAEELEAIPPADEKNRTCILDDGQKLDRGQERRESAERGQEAKLSLG